MTWRIEQADCIDAMRAMDDASVEAVVCDPPAGISFMGRAWDHHRGGMDQWVEWMAEVMREALRVAKPGAHALVWALPRTSHWTGLALERAGWHVRDVVTHLFGTGFPKSHNLEGGWGTALKPAAEFWFLARKPFSGTVEACVAEHGTGAINVDGCRIGTDEALSFGSRAIGDGVKYGVQRPENQTPGEQNPAGRWPANVVLSHTEDCQQVGTRKVKNQSGNIDPSVGPRENAVYGKDKRPRDWRAYGDADGMELVPVWECVEGCPVRMLDEQTAGLNGATSRTPSDAKGVTSFGAGNNLTIYGDSGGASRFFYVAKASSRERNAGLEGFEERKAGAMEGPNDRKARSSTQSLRDQRLGPDYERPETRGRNHHPTVKPIALMRWLVRLVTPPGGTCLDPFTGSGTTGIAAVLEGFDFVGIEREDEYVRIARARVAWWARYPPGTDHAAILGEQPREREPAPAEGQASLFDV